MMLLIERKHLSFEEWFIRLFKEGQLEDSKWFNLMGLRSEYLSLCWKEEELWRKWSENNG